LARSGISLETNSVFNSETIGYLSDSVQLITQMGVPIFDVSFAHTPPWTSFSLGLLDEEIDRVGQYFRSRCRSIKDVPWADFRTKTERALHGCPAGQNQMTLSAQGTLWGCPAFPSHFLQGNVTKEFQKFCFGDVDAFIKNPQRAYAKTMENYSQLRMDCFSTPDCACVMCREIEQCWICPLAAAFSTGEIGRIPSWRCHEARIVRRQKRRLLRQFGKDRRMGGGTFS
jgi:hypothetical protein